LGQYILDRQNLKAVDRREIFLGGMAGRHCTTFGNATK